MAMMANTTQAITPAMTPTRNESGFNVGWHNLSGPMTQLGLAPNERPVATLARA
jgi:hypothetical protein